MKSKIRKTEAVLTLKIAATYRKVSILKLIWWWLSQGTLKQSETKTIKSQQYSSIRGRFNTAIIFIIKRWRFSLTKCEFFDAALLRYGET